MGQSDNDLDVIITPLQGGGFNIEVTYWHKKRTPDKKGVKRVASYTSYSWNTDCSELVQWAKQGKTKVFFSQIRVICRRYGKRTFERID